MGEVATFLVNVERIGAGEFDVTPSVLSPTFSSVQELIWVQQTDGYKLSFPTESVGDYIIRLTFTNIGESSMVPEIESLVHLLEVIEPVEEAPIITAPARIVLEQPDVLWFEGSVEHDSPTTCLLTYTINDGTTGSLGLTPDFTWKKLMDFTDSTETLTITTHAICGQFTQLSDTFVTQVVIEGAGDDEDGDGIPSVDDNCPQGIGKDEGWVSNEATDGDRDGCKDSSEDEDDDNDGRTDEDWAGGNSEPETRFIQDLTEMNDDVGDGASEFKSTLTLSLIHI